MAIKMSLTVTSASNGYPLYRIDHNEQDIDNLQSSLKSVIEKEYSVEILDKLDESDESLKTLIENNIHNFGALDQSLIEKTFFVAIKKGYEKSIKAFLEHSLVDINIKDKDENRQTPLMLAIRYLFRYPSNNIVKLLIEKNAMINEVDEGGVTALMLATNFGDKIVVEWLVKNGSSINEKGKDGSTALTWANVSCYENFMDNNSLGKKRHKESIKIINYLKENGTEGIELIYDYKGKFWRAFVEGEVSEIEKLLNEEIIDINFQDFLGNSLLMIAARGGHEKVAQFLLIRGADVHFRNENGKSALDCAFESGDEKMVQLLLNNGASFNFKSKDAEEALKSAVIKGYEKIVKFLLENEVDVNFKNEEKESLLTFACWGWREKKEIIEMLIDMDADISCQDKYGNSPFNIIVKDSPDKETDDKEKEAWASIVLKMLSKQMNFDPTNPSLKKFILEGKGEDVDPSLADDLITKAVELTNPTTEKKLNALVLFTLDDHNGAFRLAAKLDRIRKLKQNYNVTIMHPTSIEQINSSLNEKNNLMVFSAHSDGNIMDFTKSLSLTKENIHRINFSNLANGGGIISTGCSTGGKNALGFNIARCANRTVFAPKEPGYFASLDLDEQDALRNVVFIGENEGTGTERNITNIIRPSFFTDYYNIDLFSSERKQSRFNRVFQKLFLK